MTPEEVERDLKFAIEAAREAGVTRLYGDWLPSPKNGMVEGHYAGLGFSEVGPIGEGGTRWVLDLTDYSAPDLPMVLTADLPVPA